MSPFDFAPPLSHIEYGKPSSLHGGRSGLKPSQSMPPDVYTILLSEMTARLREAEETIAQQKERLELLEALSITDELTTLFNRRGFVDAFRRELNISRRTGIGGVLVVIDLDGFKAINDTYGHLAGDTYLRQVARALREKVRSRDVVARLGGDEFAVLLTETTPEAGLARAAILSRAVNAETCRLGRDTLPLRASFGAEAFDGHDREDDITLRADTLMYKTKQERKSGR